MGEYEPRDSRIVTHSTHTAPGEPSRTGPEEDEARRRAQAEQQGERRHEKPAAHSETMPEHERENPGEEQSFDANDTDPLASPSGPAADEEVVQQEEGEQSIAPRQSQALGSMRQSQAG